MMHRLIGKLRRISAPWLAILLMATLILTPWKSGLAQTGPEAPARPAERERRSDDNGTVEGGSDNAAREQPAEDTPAESAADDANTAERSANGQDDPAGEPEEDGEAVPVPGEEGEIHLRPQPMFNREDILENLPSIAEDDPGFIPDTSPEDLFERRPGTTPRERYSSLLGESRLPEGEARDIVGIQSAAPDRDLPENFARVVVPDGSIEGSTETKQFRIRGGVIIFYNDVEITAEEADIDEKNEVAVLRESVEIVDPAYTLKTNYIKIFFKEKRFQAEGFVQFQKQGDDNAGEVDLSLPKKDRLREYLGGQRTELFANKLDYNWDTKQLSALEAVRITHPDFNGTMERLDYDDEVKNYAMYGDVILDISKYDWIFRAQLASAEDEPKLRAVTDVPTKITADKVIYSETDAIAQFYARNGNTVKFDQSGKRSVTASYIEINDTTKDFYAEGIEGQQASYSQTDGEWLFNGEIIDREEASEDLQETLRNPLTATAGTITYNYDRKRLEMREAVNIQGSGQSLTAGELVQDETAKFFLVRNNVIIKPNAEQTVTAAQVYVDTENDKFYFVGLVEGSIRDDALNFLGEQGPAQQPGDPNATGRSGLFESQPAR